MKGNCHNKGNESCAARHMGTKSYYNRAAKKTCRSSQRHLPHRNTSHDLGIGKDLPTKRSRHTYGKGAGEGE
jgi:hypothetical protein